MIVPRALIGCEFSGKVANAFNDIPGWRAWSCDFESREDGRHSEHLLGDLQPHITTTTPDGESWTLIGLHYTCTFFTNSGVQWLYLPWDDPDKPGRSREIDPARWAKLIKSANELAWLWSTAVDSGAAVYFENPRMHRFAVEEITKALAGWNGPSPFLDVQVIQPYYFGHPETKATLLHLHKLPHLKPTKDVRAEMAALPKKASSRVHYASPGKDRWKERSRTLPGIASAMATQWSLHLWTGDLSEREIWEDKR